MITNSPFGTVALSRVADMPSRVAFAVLIGIGAWIFAPGPIPALWVAAVLGAQAIDHWVAAPMRRRPDVEPPLARRAAYYVSMALSSGVYSSI
ncbi:MAG: hypothetical protein ABIO37_08155, partial [Caulobacteraceae bacterium]